MPPNCCRMGNLTCDRFLMVYDLRLLRPMTPMQVLIDPLFLRFVPTYSNRICVVSQVSHLCCFTGKSCHLCHLTGKLSVSSVSSRRYVICVISQVCHLCCLCHLTGKSSVSSHMYVICVISQVSHLCHFIGKSLVSSHR